VPGFPIRTSSDPRSVDSSPRHIAASHVLHRLPVPRHSPCALKHLHTKNTRKIAQHHNPTRGHDAARCSQPLSTNQTPHPTTKAGRQLPPHPSVRTNGLVVSKPNSVSGDPHGLNPWPALVCCAPNPAHYRRGFLTASSPPSAGMFSWCSLERR
jgi:hypothetical protein